MKNITDEEVKLTWWYGFIPYIPYSEEVVIVPKKDRILLYKVTSGLIAGALNTTPFFTTGSAYDSVGIH